jgi:hypothetical protein
MQSKKVSFLTALLSIMTVLYLLVFTPYATAQKPKGKIEEEYQKASKNYLGYLHESFAYRYISQEQFLRDIIQAVTETYSENKGVVGKIDWNRKGGDRQSLKEKLNEIELKIQSIRESDEAFAGSRVQEIEQLHAEYERLYATEFELTRSDVDHLRRQMLEKGGKTIAQKLIERQLELAFKRFKSEDYFAAALQFEDILSAFQSQFSDWVDIKYYAGLTYARLGDFDNADTKLSDVVKSSGGYTERALTELVRLAYVEGSRNRTEKYFSEYQAKVAKTTSNEDEYYRTYYYAGATYFNTSDYSKAIGILKTIPEGSRYGQPALMLIGHCYANLDDYANAEEFLQKTVSYAHSPKGTDPDTRRKISDIARLKLAYIGFERNVNGLKARNTVPLISKIGTDSDVYDAVLLVSAWAYFKDNNIDTAHAYVDSLLRSHPASDYIFEARTLLGNIRVLDPKLSDKDREIYAVDAYNYVANSMEAKYLADRFVMERDSMLTVMEILNDAMRLASYRRDSAAYLRYDAIHQLINHTVKHNGFSRAARSTGSSSQYREVINSLVSQLRVSEKLLKNAEEKKDSRQVKELKETIQSTLSDLENVLGFKSNTAILDSGSVDRSFEKLARDLGEQYASAVIDNFSTFETQTYFSQNTLPRLISEADSRNRLYSVLREKVAKEKQLVQDNLSEIDRLLGLASRQNNKDAEIRLKNEKNKLTDYYYRLTDYEMWILTQNDVEIYADLDVWGDFASYGRNNITYVINTTKSETIQDMARAISQIDNILRVRKKNYENQIAQLEKEILLKEREIREKELREMRTTSKEFFEEKYFQLKTSEKPEDDPYDYKDLVPEVVDIPQGDVVVKRDQGEEETVIEPDSAIESDSTAIMDADSVKVGETIGGGDSTAVETPADSLKSDGAVDEGKESEDTTKEKTEESGNGELGSAPVDRADRPYRLAACRDILLEKRNDQIVTGMI